jgi:hypothetical protein
MVPLQHAGEEISWKRGIKVHQDGSHGL